MLTQTIFSSLSRWCLRKNRMFNNPNMLNDPHRTRRTLMSDELHIIITGHMCIP